MIEIEGYTSKRVDRTKGKDGGGVMMMYKKELDNVVKVVREESDGVEMIWLKMDNQVVKIRMGIVYMPQEDAKTVDQLKNIYKKIEEEVVSAVKHNETLILMGDFNCKVGNAISGNTDTITKGGRLLLKMLNKHNLILLNSEKCCRGTWTRIEGEERSILDYVIVKAEEKSLFTDMVIDEDKEFTPYSMELGEVRCRSIYTDHCMIKVKANIQVKPVNIMKKKQLDKSRLDDFEKEVNEAKISEIIDCDSFQESYSLWSNKVMEITDRHSTQKKSKKKESKTNRLLIRSKHRVTKQLKQKYIHKHTLNILKKRKQLIQEHIDNERRQESKRRVEATVKSVKENGGVDSATFWEVKKRLMRTTTNEIAAIMDEDGVKQEGEAEIKEVYKRYFSKLLATKPAVTEEEKRWEKSVEGTIGKMENICKHSPAQSASTEMIKEVVKKLDVKKAKDTQNWSNEMVVRGGNEMIKSLKRIFDTIDNTMEVPADWNRMAIRTKDKKGSKLIMSNKRGLFLTNIVSKVYERVVKKRNEKMVKICRSPWQMGGVKKRSGTDNLFITFSVIERNKYLGKPTYVFFADAEKCFDKLWLDDAVIELWRQGTNIRDAMIIREMNKEARISIHTPVGETEEITCENIVRQGTVYGPDLCGVSMARVNDTGKEAVTTYGPTLVLRSTQFVDDISNAGSPRTTNNTIYNCRRLEEKKKMTFNNGNGKTEYLVVHPKKQEEPITAEVKKGKIKRAKEHKSLGLWVDERGTYEINIEKNEVRIPHMVATIQAIGSEKNLGTMAVQTRIKLMNTVIMPSILYNVEVIPQLSKKETSKLESIQHSILTKLMGVPRSTPYAGLLLETGTWTMQARVAYKKLMLYHNIKNSEDDRIIKQVLQVQEEEVRESTWYADVARAVRKYDITTNVTDSSKSVWKKEVKEKINKETENEIRTKCKELDKTRTIRNDPYTIKQYLQESTMTTATDILMTRLHMTRLQYTVSQDNHG